MSAAGRIFFTALDDARALRVAGDVEGAADLRHTAERDYVRFLGEQIDEQKNPQMELAL